MREFMIGLLVLAMMAVLGTAGILLLPLFLLLGIILRLLVGLFILLFVVWLVGKVTLLLIDSGRSRDIKELP